MTEKYLHWEELFVYKTKFLMWITNSWCQWLLKNLFYSPSILLFWFMKPLLVRLSGPLRLFFVLYMYAYASYEIFITLSIAGYPQLFSYFKWNRTRVLISWNKTSSYSIYFARQVIFPCVTLSFLRFFQMMSTRRRRLAPHDYSFHRQLHNRSH